MVGKDNRQSSDLIFCSLSAGLMSVGIDVWDVGITTTPALSYLIRQNNCDCGVMITASHNPAEYNGIKIFDSNGHKIMPKDEQELLSIYNNIETYLFENKVGKVFNKSELLHSYVDKVINSCDCLSISSCKIAIDCANGAGGHIIPYVFKTLFNNCECFNCKMNSELINRMCGSVDTNQFSNKIKEGFDIGFAFDGDADRLVVILKDGQVLSGEYLLYILAKYYKTHNMLKDNIVVTTFLTSIAVEQALKKLDIKFVRCDVGDKYVWDMMEKQNAVLGAE